MQTVTVLKGGSAAGKGSRVSQLMEYLKSLGHNCVTVVHKCNETQKTRAVGKHFPALNLFIPGKYNISNKSGLTSWNGVDYLHSAFNTAERTREVIKEMCDELEVEHLILEGEPMFLSDKYRPTFLNEFYNPSRLLSIIYFMYDNREQYDDRIVGRSGKKSGESGWSRIKGYEAEIPKTIEECKFSEKTTMIENVSVEEEPYKFVLRMMRDIIQSINNNDSEIQEWCEANSTLRKVGESDPLNKSALW